MALSLQRVLIQATANGFNTVRRDMKGLAVGMAAVSYASSRMVRAIATATDSYINLKNETKVYSTSQENANFKMQGAIKIARKMNSGLSEVGQVLQRISLAQSSVGFSDETALQIVENLTTATKLSGATAQEAEGALRQFGQGLAANRLSGQELNSVLEQIPLVAILIAEEMGKTTGELRQLGKEGKITADVLVAALGKEIPKLSEMMKNFTFSIEALTTSVRRELVLAIGKFVEKSGLLRKFQDNLVKYVIKPMENFVDVLTKGGPDAVAAIQNMNIALGALAGVMAGGAIGSLLLFGHFVGIAGFIILALAGASGAATAAFFQFREETVKVNGVVISLQDAVAAATGVIQTMTTVVLAFLNPIDFVGKKITDNMIGNWEKVKEMATGAVTKILEVFVSSFATMKRIGDAMVNFLTTGETFSFSDILTQGIADGEAGVVFLGATAEAVIENIEESSSGAVDAVGAAIRDALSKIARLREELSKPLTIPGEGTKSNAATIPKLVGPTTAELASLKSLRQEFDKVGATIIKYNELEEDLIAIRGRGIATDSELLSLERKLNVEREYALELAAREQALMDLEIAGRDGSLTFMENVKGLGLGAQNAFTEIKAQITNVGGFIESSLVEGFNEASDALVDFAVTGEGSFRSFAQSFLRLITQMIVKLTIMLAIQTALNALTGGFSSGTATATPIAPFTELNSPGPGIFPVAASGGPVQGRTPVLVGERGPELFVPPQSGSIKNATTTAGMASSQNITIVNVDDPRAALSAMESQEGEQIITNVIRRNPDLLRSIS